MKKVLLLILFVSLILTSGCTKSNNTENIAKHGVRTESLNTSSVITSSKEQKNSVDYQKNNTNLEATYNIFFFNDKSQLNYVGDFLINEPIKREISLHAIELAKLKHGILYELKFDFIKDIPDDRLNLGYFYVQKDRIYRIKPTQENLSKLKSTEILPNDCVIVCQDKELKDSLVKDERGLHQYIEVNEDKREYHCYNNLVETGYYEQFTWEKNKGLIFYKSGFGAERDSIELQQINQASISTFENQVTKNHNTYNRHINSVDIFFLGMKYEDLMKLDLYNTENQITSTNEITDDKNSWDYGHRVVWTSRLCCIFDNADTVYRITVNGDIPTSLGLKNGDTVESLEKLYGKSNNQYKFDWGEVLEYTIGNCFFYVSIDKNKIALWGISKYKYDYKG